MSEVTLHPGIFDAISFPRCLDENCMEEKCDPFKCGPQTLNIGNETQPFSSNSIPLVLARIMVSRMEIHEMLIYLFERGGPIRL